MRIAGVRIEDGAMLWVDAGHRDVEPLSRVMVRQGNEDVSGVVYVTPEQMMQRPEIVTGQIIETLPPLPGEPDGDTFPGADLPPLGGMVGDAVVTAIDPLTGEVTLIQPDGSQRSQRMRSREG